MTPLTNPPTPSTITPTQPTASTPPCGLIPTRVGRAKSDTPHLNALLNSHARTHWPTLARVDVRWRSNFAYIDGRRTDGTILKLCRLRYGGSAHHWGFAIYRASHDDYEDSYLPTGSFTGSAEEALDCACTLYLSSDTPTN